jgi:hypothetical protein
VTLSINQPSNEEKAVAILSIIIIERNATATKFMRGNISALLEESTSGANGLNQRLKNSVASFLFIHGEWDGMKKAI